MYFNFDDRHPETPGLDGAMSWRDGVLVSVLLHVVAGLALVFLPQLLPATRLEVSELERQAALARAQEQEARRFVFVQPRAEFEARQAPRMPELSDRDRSVQSPEPRPNPANPLPFSRGNTQERVDIPGVVAPPTPQPPAPPAAGGQPSQSDGGTSGQDGQSAETSFVRGLRGPTPRESLGGGSTPGDRLGEAVRNAGQYYSPEQVFNNPQGGGEFGSAIQFDTKGVEFGPWVRRFIAQIKRNWFIPYAAMSLRGRVVVTFNVHKDGRITDLQVVGPCPVEAFNNSSFNALAASNPTQPLPPEYPADQAFFTVTFYYNEAPPGR